MIIFYSLYNKELSHIFLNHQSFVRGKQNLFILFLKLGLLQLTVSVQTTFAAVKRRQMCRRPRSGATQRLYRVSCCLSLLPYSFYYFLYTLIPEEVAAFINCLSRLAKEAPFLIANSR